MTKNPKALEAALNKSLDDVFKEQEQEKEFLQFLSSANDFLDNEKYQKMKRKEEAYLKAKEEWESSPEYHKFKNAEEEVIKQIRDTSFNRNIICDIGKIVIKGSYEKSLWDTKALAEASKNNPELLNYKKTTIINKSVSIEYIK